MTTRLQDIASGLEWYALRVAPRKEFVAQRIIEGHGFTTYLPVEYKWRKKNKYTRQKDKERLRYPLLPRYLFIGFKPGDARFFRVMDQPVGVDRDTREIRFRRGVFVVFNLDIITGCVGPDDRPARIDTDGLVRLMRRFPNGLVHADEERWMQSNREFAVGDMVRVINGPFDGFVVPVVSIRINSGKARFLANLLGSDQEIEIDMKDLEAAE